MKKTTLAVACASFEDHITKSRQSVLVMLSSQAFEAEGAYSRLTLISNGNWNERCPIRSVIIRVINKIVRPKRESDLLIKSMIIDRLIGQHEVLLARS